MPVCKYPDTIAMRVDSILGKLETAREGLVREATREDLEDIAEVFEENIKELIEQYGWIKAAEEAALSRYKMLPVKIVKDVLEKEHPELLSKIQDAFEEELVVKEFL